MVIITCLQSGPKDMMTLSRAVYKAGYQTLFGLEFLKTIEKKRHMRVIFFFIFTCLTV